MSLKQIFNEEDDFTRRGFMSGVCGSMLGVGSMPLFARAANLLDDDDVPLRPATARNVIYLYMSGGMSQLDTFDPKPGTETGGPTKAIKTAADAVRISEHMKTVARHMDKVVLFSGIQSTQGAHDQGNYLMHTSYEPRGTIKHPPLGVWVNRMAGRLNPMLPGHVAIRSGSHAISKGFMAPQFTPLPIGDPLDGLRNSKRREHVSEKQFDRRLERIKALNKDFKKRYPKADVKSYVDVYDQAIKLMRSRDLAAFDLANEPAEIREAYGNDRFGQGCLLARRLVEHGVRFIEVAEGGWDTHSRNFDALSNKAPRLDRALGALIADLDGRGLLDETLIVLATEFGRTPRINENQGRDHWPKGFTCLIAGGGVRGGQRWGSTNETGLEIADKRVTVPDFNATIAYGLGLPTEHILYSPSGRPFTVAHKGQPVKEIYA